VPRLPLAAESQLIHEYEHKERGNMKLVHKNIPYCKTISEEENERQALL
jgi:hypothetical protein